MSKIAMNERYNDAHNLLVAVANQLDRWATESRRGGWSTHQVAPQWRLADQIRRFLSTSEVPVLIGDLARRHASAAASSTDRTTADAEPIGLMAAPKASLASRGGAAMNTTDRATAKKFRPEKNKDGGFPWGEWRSYWESLTEGERQSLRDKAAWEHMTLAAVAMEWGASEPEPAAAAGGAAPDQVPAVTTQRTQYDRVAEAIGWLEVAVQQGGKLGGKRREVERALGYLRDHQESKGGAA